MEYVPGGIRRMQRRTVDDEDIKEVLNDFFEQLESSKEELATLRGQIKAEEEYQKKEFGISTIEEGNEKIKLLEKENVGLRNRRDELFSELMQKLEPQE